MRVTNEILGVRGLNGYGVKVHTNTKVSGINELWMKNFSANPNCSKNGGKEQKEKQTDTKKQNTK